MACMNNGVSDQQGRYLEAPGSASAMLWKMVIC